MKNVVGYIRVSTQRQAEEGMSLDEQAHLLRGYSKEKKKNLITIEEDDCSAAGADGHLFRPGLRRAFEIAKQEEAAILVPSADRLARHSGVLQEILDSGLRVISVTEGGYLSKQALQRLLDKAQRNRDLISKRVREGAKRAKANGVKLGNRTNLDVAQRKGAISNMGRSERKALELADFIEQIPGWDKMTLKDRVSSLNQSGPHNLVSEKRDERRPWTISSLRKPLKKAEAELQLRSDMEDEGIHVSEIHPSAFSCGNEDKDVVKEDLPVEVAYKDHPDFGKF